MPPLIYIYIYMHISHDVGIFVRLNMLPHRRHNDREVNALNAAPFSTEPPLPEKGGALPKTILKNCIPMPYLIRVRD